MPTIYLGVASNFNPTGIVGQGTIDTTPGATLGTVLTCPGSFPCLISARSSVRGAGTVVVDNVYAGPNHLIIKQSIHDYIPAAGNRVRVENKSVGINVVGGTLIQSINTTNPVISPYYNISNTPSLSLAGLPKELYLGQGGSFAVVIAGSGSNPADPLNFAARTDNFAYNFNRSQLVETGNLFWNNATTGSTPLSINVAAVGDSSSYLLENSNPAISLRSAYIPYSTRYPLISNNQVVDADDFGIQYLEPSFRSTSNLLAVANGIQFSCFNATTGQLTPFIFGTQTAPNFVKNLSILPTPDSILKFSFVGIRGNNTAFIGAFTTGAGAPGNNFSTTFFHLHTPLSGALSAATKPSFGFSTLISSVQLTGTTVTGTKSYWSDGYPAGSRLSQYDDVQSMQYGYVLLNKDTKHLEFMFTAHVDPWMQSADAQVINKIMHAPPRSADHIPASNMRLGVDPRTPTANSIYRSTDATIKGRFNADQIIHGGGGHLFALGTYNGAIINNGKVVVWGSNRWGQLVTPASLREANVFLVDVAVSNAPPVLSGLEGQLFYDSIYSEEYAEKTARNFNSSIGTLTYSYPYDVPTTYRYGQHINYTNLPGHVLVVTQEGWVYAWGNNKYYQCEVPDEISLVDSSGQVKTTLPVDPIAEVSAGAFHSVARSKSGAIYVWGAGALWAGTAGRHTSVTDIFNAPLATTSSVHFGQSCLYAGAGELSSGFAHLAVPNSLPPGTNSATAENYDTANMQVYTSVTTLSKVVSGGSTVNIGQKTQSGFSVSENTAGSLTRMKGMIAAGAFHTAIIDSFLKIQCIGAGRGTTSTFAFPITGLTQNSASGGALWGSSYSEKNQEEFATYPHYCQSISQYRAPANGATATNNPVGLFRSVANTTTANKSRYFQDLLFKKVVCGPFSTHGIIFSVSRVNGTTPTEKFTALDQTYLHGRVVSWGCAFSPRRRLSGSELQDIGTGPTGIRGTNPQASVNFASITPPVPANNATYSGYNTDPLNNPAGTLCGMGSIFSDLDVNRMFEIINRSMGTVSGVYVNETSLVGAPSPNSTASATPSVGVVSTATNVGAPLYNTDCPITITRFKVKDIACCGDFTMYIGYLSAFSRTDHKLSANDINTQSLATFDYQASVFFTGNDYYNSTNYPDYDTLPNRMHANCPYSGNLIGRRNKKEEANNNYVWPESAAMPITDRSLHFGPIRRVVPNLLVGLPGDASSNRSVAYVLPTTAAASCNLVAAVVNMDNRPTAWMGYVPLKSSYIAYLDLSLLPSVPIQSFKAGKGHILAVTDGDWPVATSLATATMAPKLVTELGTALFLSVPAQTVTPELIHGEGVRYRRPTLIAWGAGDGREFGTTLLSFAPPVPTAGAGSTGGGSFYIPKVGSDSTFGLGFIDTHAVSRYDASYAIGGTIQGFAVNVDDWENYYGHYRWNVNSTLIEDYDSVLLPTLEVRSTYAAMFGPPGHHAIEAMQSLLGFQQHLYPSTFTNPALGSRNLLNGTQKAAVPAAAFMPFVTSASQTGINAVCCSTASEEAGNLESLNALLEYHSPLGYTQQTYTDYVVDYAAGGMHSAVLFKSSCINWAQINANIHLASVNAFSTYFMADTSGVIPFGQRRVCKLGLFGYGCEGQTAGSERILQDGSVAPIVPRLFGTDAKVYCGDSYTLVTNPIRIVEASSGTVALTLPEVGAGFTSKTIPISIPSSAYSKRIRGLDVRIQVSTSAGTVNLPMSSWVVTIPYKQNEWTVFSRLKANLDTTAADAFIQAGTTPTVFRVSDRFSPSLAYTYTGAETYNEQGLNPTSSSSYTGTGPYFLRPINSAAAVPALDRQGCYYPVIVDPGTFTVVNQSWNVQSATFSGVVLPFNEPTINVVIKDYTSAASYPNCFINITLEVEVDAEDVPYVIYGPNKSGVWNEEFGNSPSFGADIQNFSNSTAEFNPNRWLQNCPCELDSTMLRRNKPVGYPADPRFICGTKKYGPAGNRETAAVEALSDSVFGSSLTVGRTYALLQHKVTANFFSVFTRIKHRPLLKTKIDVNTLNPSLQALPSSAFIAIGGPVNIESSLNTCSSSSLAIPFASTLFRRDLKMNPGYVAGEGKLLTNSPILYNKTLFPPSVQCSSSAGMTVGKNLSVLVGLASTNCF